MNAFETAAETLLTRHDETARLMLQDEPSEESVLGIYEEHHDAPASLITIRDELRSIELDTLDTAKGTTVHYVDVELPKPRKIQRHFTMPLAYEVAVSYTPQGAPYHRVTKSVTRALPRKDETAHDIEFLDRTPIQEYDPDEEVPDYEQMSGIGYKADQNRAQLREIAMPGCIPTDEYGTPINDVLGHTQAHDYEDVGMIEAPYTGNGHAWAFWAATRDALSDLDEMLARARREGEVEASPSSYVEPAIPLSPTSDADPVHEPVLVPAARRKAEDPEVWDAGEPHEVRIYRMQFMPRKVWNWEFQRDLAESYWDTALSGLETAVAVSCGPLASGWTSGRVFIATPDGLKVSNQLTPRQFERPGPQTYSVLRVPTGWLARHWADQRGGRNPKCGSAVSCLRGNFHTYRDAVPMERQKRTILTEARACETQLLMLREVYRGLDGRGRAVARLAAAAVHHELRALRGRWRCLTTEANPLWNRKPEPDEYDRTAIALGRQFAYLTR